MRAASDDGKYDNFDVMQGYTNYCINTEQIKLNKKSTRKIQKLEPQRKEGKHYHTMQIFIYIASDQLDNDTGNTINITLLLTSPEDWRQLNINYMYLFDFK